MTRDWATIDFYAVLGVAPGADADTISDAFRARAKQMHPDVVGDVGPLAERFKEVTAAYEVLSDPQRRRDYDASRRAASADAGTVPTGLPARAAQRPRAIQPAWSGRRVRWVVAAGLVSVLLGVAFAVFIVVLNDREAADRARRVPIAGTAAVGKPGVRLAYLAPGLDRPYLAAVGEVGAFPAAPGDTVTLRYVASNPLEVAYGVDVPARFDASVEALVVTTDGGAVVVFAVGDRPYVVADPTSTRGAGLSDGAAVPMLARADDPTDVVVAEQHGARNVAFWIVAIKLIVAGPLLVWFARVRGSSSATR